MSRLQKQIAEAEREAAGYRAEAKVLDRKAAFSGSDGQEVSACRQSPLGIRPRPTPPEPE